VAEQRPARKYYEVTEEGGEALAEARKRFRLLDQLEQPSQSKLKPARGKG
jgi:DNA-binding PadR family transcriptional regulator